MKLCFKLKKEGEVDCAVDGGEDESVDDCFASFAEVVLELDVSSVRIKDRIIFNLCTHVG